MRVQLPGLRTAWRQRLLIPIQYGCSRADVVLCRRRMHRTAAVFSQQVWLLCGVKIQRWAFGTSPKPERHHIVLW